MFSFAFNYNGNRREKKMHVSLFNAIHKQFETINTIIKENVL